MVQKYVSPVRVYKYPFELVMKAYERRFPSCPQIPVVINCEIISDWTSPDKSLKKTERKCKLHVDAPYLLKKWIWKIVDAPYCVTNDLIHKDLNILTTTDTPLTYNTNPLALTLTCTTNPYIPPRRLLRLWPRDLLTQFLL